MSDTTTTLYPGVGGDVLDEELITQSDGVTSAKAPRVMARAGVGAGEGSPARMAATDNSSQMPTMDPLVHQVLCDMRLDIKEIKEMIFEALTIGRRS